MADDSAVIVDTSKWQGKMNLTLLYKKAHAMILRASVGMASDINYVTYLAELIAMGLAWAAYHYLSAWADPRKQARKFADLVGKFDRTGKYNLYSTLPFVVLDVEEAGLLTPSALYNHVRAWVNEFKAYTGMVGPAVWLYTRASFWNPSVSRSAWTRGLPLFVAHYNKFIERPDVPADYQPDDWRIWQYDADGNRRGHEFGVSSWDIDVNRYRGGLTKLRQDFPNVRFGGSAGEPPPPPPTTPPPTQEDDVLISKVLTAEVNVRNNIKPSIVHGPVPGTVYKPSSIYFVLKRNDPVEILEVIPDGNNLWARVGQRQVVAIHYDGTQYLEISN